MVAVFASGERLGGSSEQLVVAAGHDPFDAAVEVLVGLYVPHDVVLFPAGEEDGLTLLRCACSQRSCGSAFDNGRKKQSVKNKKKPVA